MEIVVIFYDFYPSRDGVGLLSWVSSGKGDWCYRKEIHGTDDGKQIHVHVARKKHLKTKNKQVSWNIDGTRHDKKSFDENIDGMNTAKQVASDALGISKDLLQFITEVQAPLLIPVEISIYVFTADNELL